MADGAAVPTSGGAASAPVAAAPPPPAAAAPAPAPVPAPAVTIPAVASSTTGVPAAVPLPMLAAAPVAPAALAAHHLSSAALDGLDASLIADGPNVGGRTLRARQKKTYLVPGSDDEIEEDVKAPKAKKPRAPAAPKLPKVSPAKLDKVKPKKAASKKPDEYDEDAEDDEEEGNEVDEFGDEVPRGGGSGSEDEDDGDNSKFHVELFLMHRTLQQSAWRTMMQPHVTQYVIEGSLRALRDVIPIDTTHTDERVTRVLVKWRGLSLLHASWETEEDLIRYGGDRLSHRLRRYRGRWSTTTEEDVPVPVIERVLGKRPRVILPAMLALSGAGLGAPGSGAAFGAPPAVPPPAPVPVGAGLAAAGAAGASAASGAPAAAAKFDDSTEYLIKWEGQPYEECSWEVPSDLSDNAPLEAYEKLLKVPRPRRKPTQTRRSPAAYVKIDKPPVDNDGDNELRSYQLEGVNWLVWNWAHGRNSILADEMGLGKTVQTIFTLNTIRTQYGAWQPMIVIAPLSTLPHWYREIQAWTHLNGVVYHGNTKGREILRRYELFEHDGTGVVVTGSNGTPAFDILVTTYEMMLRDLGFLSSFHWSCVVVDEAHRLKNRGSRLFQALQRVKMDATILLTGTPLQNNLQELWTLLHCLDPGNFPRLEPFLAQFGSLSNATELDALRQLLRPYLLRRDKSDVELTLPPREETVILVELTPLQKQVYRALYEGNLQYLARGKRGRAGPMLNLFMQLRKCCNHPYLIEGVEDRVRQGLDGNVPTDSPAATDMVTRYLSASSAAERDDAHARWVYNLVYASGKIVLLFKLLPKLRAQGSRVLIFSQMVAMLDLLEQWMLLEKYPVERLDGSCTGRGRQASIDRFSSNSEAFVFLLSTRAGGVGINLTAADTVIIFDSDWNPQNDVQAQARCHRIGQTKSVQVYRLITDRSYETEMFERASKKLGLDQAVLHNMGNSAVKKAPSNAELEALLRHGAYDLVTEGGRDRGQAFCEADIDSILSMAKKISYNDGEAKTAEEAAVASSFSKASFVTNSDNGGGVSLDDPDFWKKCGTVIGDGSSQSASLLPTKRKRTQINYKDSISAIPITLPPEPASMRRAQKLSSKAAAAAPVGTWTVSEQRRWLQALSSIGVGRWEYLRQVAGLKKFDDSTLAIATCWVVALCAWETELADDSKFRTMAATETALKSKSPSEIALIQNQVVDASMSALRDSAAKHGCGVCQFAIKTFDAADAAQRGALPLALTENFAWRRVLQHRWGRKALYCMRTEMVLSTISRSLGLMTPAEDASMQDLAWWPSVPADKAVTQFPFVKKAVPSKWWRGYHDVGLAYTMARYGFNGYMRPFKQMIQDGSIASKFAQALDGDVGALPDAAEEAELQAQVAKKIVVPKAVATFDASAPRRRGRKPAALIAAEKAAAEAAAAVDGGAKVDEAAAANGAVVKVEGGAAAPAAVDADGDIDTGAGTGAAVAASSTKASPAKDKPKDATDDAEPDEDENGDDDDDDDEAEGDVDVEAEAEVDGDAADELAFPSASKLNMRLRRVLGLSAGLLGIDAPHTLDSGKWKAWGITECMPAAAAKPKEVAPKSAKKEGRTPRTKTPAPAKKTAWRKVDVKKLWNAVHTFGIPVPPPAGANPDSLQVKTFNVLAKRLAELAECAFVPAHVVAVAQALVAAAKAPSSSPAGAAADDASDKEDEKGEGAESGAVAVEDTHTKVLTTTLQSVVRGFSRPTVDKWLDRVIVFEHLRFILPALPATFVSQVVGRAAAVTGRTTARGNGKMGSLVLPQRWNPAWDYVLLRGVCEFGTISWAKVLQEDVPMDISDPSSASLRSSLGTVGIETPDLAERLVWKRCCGLFSAMEYRFKKDENSNTMTFIPPSETGDEPVPPRRRFDDEDDDDDDDGDHDMDGDDFEDDGDDDLEDDEEDDGEDADGVRRSARRAAKRSRLRLSRSRSRSGRRTASATPTGTSATATPAVPAAEPVKPMSLLQFMKKLDAPQPVEYRPHPLSIAAGTRSRMPRGTKRKARVEPELGDAELEARNAAIAESRALYEEVVKKVPFVVGTVVVESLGQIDPRPTYHSDKYIWPVGFKTRRTFDSFVENCKTDYISEILDGGDAGPKFKVTAEDAPDQPFEGASATAAWMGALKAALAFRKDQRSKTAVSGPSQMGYANPVMAAIIEGLPGSEQCSMYAFKGVHSNVAAAAKKITTAAAAAATRANKAASGMADSDVDDVEDDDEVEESDEEPELDDDDDDDDEDDDDDADENEPAANGASSGAAL